jgi:hypothetical protein
MSKHSSNKKDKGQFYTTNSSYILEGLELPSSIKPKCIIEPFAGQGDLLNWISTTYPDISIEAYDIDPKRADITQRDTLTDPPDYRDTYVITNPPYLAKNKSDNKEIYDLYDTNDLYKCFILSLSNSGCLGGIIIIPAGFFFSHRDIDQRCRHEFMTKYRIIRVKYFEESVFEDTTTTTVAFSFIKLDINSASDLTEQNVEWISLPSKQQKTFQMSAKNAWIIGGDIYNLPMSSSSISIRRYVYGQSLRDDEYQTFMTLNALDSGTQDGRICIKYKKDYVYPAKECSRTYATLLITGKQLTEDEQIDLCNRFNNFLEKRRQETWSLFLPQYRESKEYARKRIPFELVYHILLHLIS